jgi:hypothetical protein
MNNIKLGSVAIKLLGVYAIIQSLPLIQYLVFPIQSSIMGSDDTPRQLLYYVTCSIPFLLSLLLGIILIICSERVAHIIFRYEEYIPSINGMPEKEFQAICFSAVAVLVFLNSLPKLCMLIMNIWQIRQLRMQGVVDSNRYSINAWESGISFLVQFTIAIILFFGSRGLANFWHRIQAAKYVKINDDKNEQDS